MGSTLNSSNCNNCNNCNEYKKSIMLLESKLKDRALIYEDSIKTYRKALTDREYELLMRECEVVREIDGLKSVISSLTKELELLGAKVKIEGTEVDVLKPNNLLLKNHTVNCDKLSKVKKGNSIVNENVKTEVNIKVKEKESVKETVNSKVNKNVKEELKNSCNKQKEVSKVGKNGDLSIVLPEVLGLTDAQRLSLRFRAEEVEKYIKTDAKVCSDGVAYPCRRLTLIKNHVEFFISVMLLVENTPKARGSYAWTRVTNMLKECDDYKLLVNNFLTDTNFKLTYLNIRNWYMSLMEIIGDMD